MSLKITNYSTLVQAVVEAMENDSAELTSYLPIAIANAEEKLFRELDLPALESEQTGTLTPSVSSITKPTGFKFTDYFMVKANNKYHVLRKKFKSFLLDYWPDTTQTDIPKYYADESATTIYIAPTPASNYEYILRYSKPPTGLTATANTNYYTSNCPQILFHAVMIEIARFMKAWSQVPVWEAAYARGQEGWNIEMMRYRRDGQTTPQTTDDGPNSLKHTITTQS